MKMAHITFASYATPEQHDRIKKQINNMKLRFKGNKRQGYYIPALSELRLYDVRLKKECVPEFLKNMEMHNLDKKSPKITKEMKKKLNDKGKNNTDTHIPKFIKPILRVFRKILGYDKIPEYVNLDFTHKPIKGWKQNLLIGVKDDPYYNGKEIL